MKRLKADSTILLFKNIPTIIHKIDLISDSETSTIASFVNCNKEDKIDLTKLTNTLNQNARTQRKNIVKVNCILELKLVIKSEVTKKGINKKLAIIN